ncbi:MAG: hypothetical protein HQL36_00725 [Alphaproteobacteria bacterium]|nr:hypothetical protein [Alphaproteobacteria bacterium]
MTNDTPHNDRDAGESGAHQTYTPPNMLKIKVGDGAERIPPELEKKVNAIIAAEKDGYFKMLGEEVGELLKLKAKIVAGKEIDAASRERIYAIGHRVRSEAGMNDLYLIGTVANLLCECLDHPDGVKGSLIAFVALHIDAMGAIYAGGQNVDSNAIGSQIIEGFKQARAKLLK